MEELRLYGSSPVLLTDLYQLTMAYGYWKTGVDTKEAVFNLFFRENPFQGGYSICCGLAYLTGVLERFHFENSDLTYLQSLHGNDGRKMFDDAFLDYLSDLTLSCDIDAIPEGTAVFPHEPLVRVTGPLIQCQLLETILLNIINFQTLIATKAARICEAACGDPVIDFGLRRAQGFDGAITACRASYIGGCVGTSNVLAGKIFGIPVKGTHAHSWVMAFDEELEAFMAYAQAMPNNCVLLVDTYDTIGGVYKAVETGKWLRNHGHTLAGIRLDSGDLLSLSTTARRLLDEAGFENTVIVGSNELDEYRIAHLKKNGAPISVWGVGTRLITAYDNPALGGVYKLVAVRRPGEQWDYKVKLSDEAMKTTNPGILQVRRFISNNCFAGDVMFDVQLGINDENTAMHGLHNGSPVEIPRSDTTEDLLVPVVRNGRPVYSAPTLDEIRNRVRQQLSQLPAGVKRLEQPSCYPVGLEPGLARLKERLVRKA